VTASGDPRASEEPWEAEIGALLGALPPVDPPDGFLAAALNHRPLYAGRTMAGLLAATAAAVVLALGVGVSNPSVVLPELDAMTQRHLAAQADLGPRDEPAAPDGGAAEAELTAGFLASRLGGYELVHVVETDELHQSIYRGRDGAAFSVFVEAGAVDWVGLPLEGLTDIGGTRAWSDPDREATIVQLGDETVTIVGFPLDEIGTLLTDVPDEARSFADRAQELVTSIVAHLGYPAG